MSVIEECNKFLDSKGAQYNDLSNILRNHFTLKKDILKLLGLNEKNDYRVSFNIPVTLDSRPKVYAMYKFIEWITKGEYKVDTEKGFYLLNNRGNKYKISSVVNDKWDAILASCGEFITDSMIAEGRLEFMKFYAKYYDQKNIKDAVLCNIGETIKNDKLITLSANPYDYFTASDDINSGKYCAYTSCIRFGGQYFNTVMDYLNSDSVLIVYTSNISKPFYKIGRMINYVSEKKVVQTRPFGTFSDFDRDLIGLYIMNKIGRKFSRLGRNPNTTDFTVERAPYLDYQGVCYVSDKGAEKFKIAAGLCMICNSVLRKEEQNDSQTGICISCVGAMDSCKHCGKSFIGKNLVLLAKKKYCKKCVEQVGVIVCDYCGEEYLNDNIRKWESKKVCTTCYKKLCDKTMIKVDAPKKVVRNDFLYDVDWR
jgi:hypothetical protein